MTRNAHRRSIWNLLILFIFGIGITIVLCEKEVVAGSTVNPSTEEISEGGDSLNGTKKNYTLTGNPRIDYVHDPNLPRELNGYNLSSYPFFNKVPPNISFKCDGLKDGFYASVEHKCQLYHHCLYGTRYDFLCANYTAFDQRTFICTFVSDIDCDNSADFFHRNNALYVGTTTTTQAPIYIGPRGRRIRPAVAQAFRERERDYDSAPDPPPRKGSTTPAPAKTSGANDDTHAKPKDEPVYDDEDYPLPLPPRRRNRRRCGPGRRRRCRRPRPRDYYDEYDDYEDYYDTGRRGGGSRHKDKEYEEDDYEDAEEDTPAKLKRKNKQKAKVDKTSTTTASTTTTPAPVPHTGQSRRKPTYEVEEVHEEPQPDPETLAANRDNLFARSRAPPKIRPPVPINEKRKYNNIQGREVEAPSAKHRSSSTSVSTTTTTTPAPVEYEYEEDYEQPSSSSTTVQSTKAKSRFIKHHSTTLRTTTSTTTTTTTTPAPSTPEPQYDYEYVEYDSAEQVPETTTSTTKKPPRLYAGRRHQVNSPEPVHTEDTADESRLSNTALQSPTLSPGTTEHLKIIEALETPSNPSFRQPYQNRPRPSSAKTYPLVAPATTSTTTTTTESERKSDLSFGPSYDGMNRRFPAFDTVSTHPTETMMVGGGERERTHRPRQRNPARLQFSSTTTEAPSAEEYLDFQEEEPETEMQMPERYGQKSIIMPTPEYQYSQQPISNHAYPATRNFVHPNHIRSTTLQPIEEISQNPSPAPQVSTNFQHFYQNSYNPRLRETTPRVPSITTNFVSSFPTSATPISNRPEFISLLSEDDDTVYYSQAQQQQQSSRPSQRFSVGGGARVNNNRGLLSSAQQIFPSFTIPQSSSQYSSPFSPKSIRPRNIFQMYSPFSYPGY